LEIKEHSTLGTEALRPKSDKSNPPSKYIFATDADLKSVRPRSMEKCEVGTGNGDVTYKIIPENPFFKGKILGYAFTIQNEVIFVLICRTYHYLIP